MSQSRILADSIAQPLCAGATLVTANNRLAREIRQQFNQYQRTQGKQVWETADILPFEAWVFRLWQSIHTLHGQSATTQGERMVLNALQSKAVWTHIISDDINKNQHNAPSLWNVAATVKTVMEAWRICRQWDIALDECGKSWLADHRSFVRWANSFTHRCEKNNWIDGQQLVDVVITEWAGTLIADALADAELIWMGFDGFNAQQARLIEILQHNNIRLCIHKSDSDSEADCQFHQYESESAQWLAAAHWIKDKIERDPHQRLAVVAPNLHQSRHLIEHTLSQVLSPHHLFDSGSSRDKPFHISLGVKLIDAPVVDAALLLLSLTSTEVLPSATIRSVILSPFIGGADSECDARNKFEFWCRQYLPYELKFPKFLDLLKQGQYADTPLVFLEKINANSELMATIKEKRSFSAWSEFFLTWLDNFGWSGERALNSEQYQTVDAFKREVCVLRSLDMLGKQVNTSVTAATALTVLQQRLSEQPFEAESPPLQVDVLGIMETTGIQFDAIWFGNLTERVWPPALQASPFIPHKLQQQAGYHRAKESLNMNYARVQQSRLRSQCNEMVLSYYTFERDVELLPSALCEQATATTAAQPRISLPSLIKRLQENKPQLDTFTDTKGLSISESDSVTRGGISVIRDQAACPFRAYARHRLGARDVELRQPGLDAADRGSLIHGVLEGVWREIETSEKLASLSDNALEQIIDKHIRACSKRFFHQSGGKSFFKAQAQWISQLLQEWFAVEKSRTQAFRVVALEQQQQLHLGKLTLNFKIDRIDRLADNTLRLIDYKTGATGAIVGWFGDRPKEPQLPLYALTQYASTKQNNDAVLAELYFGQVRAGECKYAGINENNLLKTAKRVVRKFSGLEGTQLDKLKQALERYDILKKEQAIKGIINLIENIIDILEEDQTIRDVINDIHKKEQAVINTINDTIKDTFAKEQIVKNIIDIFETKQAIKDIIKKAEFLAYYLEPVLINWLRLRIQGKYYFLTLPAVIETLILRFWLDTVGVEVGWSIFIEYWDKKLTELANQYYAGHAEVNPLDKTTCRYCDLHGLCRIDELRLDNHALAMPADQDDLGGDDD